jgi:hypothetical protein
VFEHLADEELSDGRSGDGRLDGGGARAGTITFAAFNDALRAFRGGVPVTP